MRHHWLLLPLLLACCTAGAEIAPAISLPEGFNKNKFSARIIEENSHIHYVRELDGCSDIKFKDYFFLQPNLDVAGRNTPKNVPIQEWFCLFSSGVYENGYDRSMAERVAYSKEKGLWVKKKNKKSDVIPSDQKMPYQPLVLYNIKAKNAAGYAVIDKNITSYDKNSYRDDNLKKLISFCLIRGQFALCGSGNLITTRDGKEVDLTPYALKSLESMEIGIDNPLSQE